MVYKEQEAEVDPKEKDVKDIAGDAYTFSRLLICGPDITKNVLNVLDKIFRDFDSWDIYKRERKCKGITESNPYFDSAWDIDQLSPGMVPGKPGQTGWFQSYARPCCTPDDPCAPTVRFLGACHHAQVVNYVLWGAMTQLCGYSTTNPLRHWIRSGTPLIPGTDRRRSLGGSDPNYAEQKVMSQVGETYMKRLWEQKRDEGRFVRSDEQWQRIFDERRQELEKIISANETNSHRPEKACTAKCEPTPRQQQFLDKLQFGYVWYEKDEKPLGEDRRKEDPRAR